MIKSIIYLIIGFILIVAGVFLMIDFLKLFLKSAIGLLLLIIGINLVLGFGRKKDFVDVKVIRK